MSRSQRQLAAVCLALALGLLTWSRSGVPPPNHTARLSLVVLPQTETCCTAGALQLLGAWHLTSANSAFGGYSALVTASQDELWAFTDRGYFVRFAKPGANPIVPQFGSTLAASERSKAGRDMEAASWDPVTKRLWLAQERENAVVRYGPEGRREAARRMPEWRDWLGNYGPEAMVRLRDGRFIVLCECRASWLGPSRYPGFLYADDPIRGGSGTAFIFAGPDGYRPTAAAALPDGRILILMRRLVWPVPARFAIKVVIADPAEIVGGQLWQGRELANIAAPWPVDNYEGLAIERDPDGKLVAWIISDDNGAASQRTLLLKISIDEARLPPKQKAPG